MSTRLAVLREGRQVSPSDSRGLLLSQASGEFVFAVVGHVGSGTSVVAKALKGLLETEKVGDVPFDVEIISARDVISPADEVQVAKGSGKSLQSVTALQDSGDDLRKRGDHAIVARRLIRAVRDARARKLGLTPAEGEPAHPDGKPRAYILDSIRHPAEVELLRRVYDAAFALIGVVCEPETRRERITKKYKDAGQDAAQAFMERDSKSGLKHGQRVSDAFHLADYFVDNSLPRFIDDKKTSNPHWGVPEQLSRFVKILLHSEVVRPTNAERAMHAAEGAKAASACLSRQVGACLIDSEGSIIATGTNEVPRAGGGTYADGLREGAEDGRCAFRTNEKLRYCSNTRQQNGLIEEVVEALAEALKLDGDAVEKAHGVLSQGRIRRLLEFSRAVHAEMNALLRATRAGRSTTGGRMFVTTFPCHYCARHLVAAGLMEVQYIEPYPKSLAFELHQDAIRTVSSAQGAARKNDQAVLFKPFTGVAPRLYSRAFLKDRELKNADTGDLVYGEPQWGTPWHVGKISYVQLEAELSKEASDVGSG